MDRESMGRAVAQGIRDLSGLDTDEVMTTFHASAFELARRSGQTPRTIAEALFAASPTDEAWRTEILPVVASFSDEA